MVLFTARQRNNIQPTMEVKSEFEHTLTITGPEEAMWCMIEIYTWAEENRDRILDSCIMEYEDLENLKMKSKPVADGCEYVFTRGPSMSERCNSPKCENSSRCHFHNAAFFFKEMSAMPEMKNPELSLTRCEFVHPRGTRIGSRCIHPRFKDTAWCQIHLRVMKERERMKVTT